MCSLHRYICIYTCGKVYKIIRTWKQSSYMVWRTNRSASAPFGQHGQCKQCFFELPDPTSRNGEAQTKSISDLCSDEWFLKEHAMWGNYTIIPTPPPTCRKIVQSTRRPILSVLLSSHSHPLHQRSSSSHFSFIFRASERSELMRGNHSAGIPSL